MNPPNRQRRPLIQVLKGAIAVGFLGGCRLGGGGRESREHEARQVDPEPAVAQPVAVTETKDAGTSMPIAH